MIVKKLADAGIRTGYYKAALSGAKSIGDSDAGYVKKIAGITQEDTSLLSYLYQNAVSPHLAAQIEGNPVDPEKIKKDFDKVKSKFDYVTVEGSGGIVCPIRWDKEHKILLEDIVKALDLNTLVIADAGLGTINAVTYVFPISVPVPVTKIPFPIILIHPSYSFRQNPFFLILSPTPDASRHSTKSPGISNGKQDKKITAIVAGVCA